MKKSDLIKIVKEELRGWSPQIGQTKGLTPDTLNKILTKIAKGEEDEDEELAEEKPGLWANIRAKRARGEKPAHKNSNAHKDAVAAGKKINAMSEGQEWPEEVPSRHGDIIFKLIKVMPDRAKYALLDAETGKEWEPGGRVFTSITSLMASAEDTIMPQGGRQSSQF